MIKNKICYLMHISWRHIFQRPHILYMQLEKDYECMLVEKVHMKNMKLKKQAIEPKNKISVLQLPKTGTNTLLNSISNFYTKIAIRKAMKTDIVWVCHPELYRLIPRNYQGIIIYDCMDNYSTLGHKTSIEDTNKYEIKLIERADIIIASSQYLFNKINKPAKTILVRNGYLQSDAALPIASANVSNSYTISYFGTVASWFDFELIESSLEQYSDIQYQIIGPVEGNLASSHDNQRIVFTGPVPHADLKDYIKDSNALIMPFIINDTILAVDPVKLYEYINMGKCIISIRYPEVERFEPFVYFYHDKESYMNLIASLKSSGFKPKYDSSLRASFLQENTWESRYECINNRIQKLLSGEKNV